MKKSSGNVGNRNASIRKIRKMQSTTPHPPSAPKVSKRNCPTSTIVAPQIVPSTTERYRSSSFRICWSHVTALETFSAFSDSSLR